MAADNTCSIPLALDNVRTPDDFLQYGQDVIRSKVIPPWNTVLFRDDLDSQFITDILLKINKYIMTCDGQIGTERQRAYLCGLTDENTAKKLAIQLNRMSGFVCDINKVDLPSTRDEWECRCEQYYGACLYVTYNEYGPCTFVPVGVLAPSSSDHMAYYGGENEAHLRELMNSTFWNVNIIDTVYNRNILLQHVLRILEGPSR